MCSWKWYLESEVTAFRVDLTERWPIHDTESWWVAEIPVDL